MLEYDPDPPTLAPSDWIAFRGHSHRKFAVFDRTELTFRPDELPFARGAVLASEQFLQSLNLRRSRPQGWHKYRGCDFYRQTNRIGDRELRGLTAEAAPVLWMIRRRFREIWCGWGREAFHQVLVFRVGSTPLLIDDPVQAMQLARLCDEDVDLPVVLKNSFRWVPTKPRTQATP